MLTLIQGDALEKLSSLDADSVQCCVTSPPYWGLRDYGCEGQIGLEETSEQYVTKMVEVFREVRRVLKKDGTLWLNLGDSYARNGGEQDGVNRELLHLNGKQKRMTKIPAFLGLKPKDLCGIPWRVAFALQADGWYLRSDIIWHKPNPMPESVTDRPTKAHEYLFLLSKQERYYYDADAIKEQINESQVGRIRSDAIGGKSWLERNQNSKGGQYEKGFTESGTNGSSLALFGECSEREGLERTSRTPLCAMPEMVRFDEENRRNKRSVWTVPTAPYVEAHFATFPPDLIKPCILAGSRPGDTILDPFGGSGTTGAVAIEFGRKAILIELNSKYISMIERRCTITPGFPI